MACIWVVSVFGIVAVHLHDDLDIHWMTFRRPSAIVGFHHLDVSESVARRGVNSTYHLVVFVIFGHLDSPSRFSSHELLLFARSSRTDKQAPAMAVPTLNARASYPRHSLIEP